MRSFQFSLRALLLLVLVSGLLFGVIRAFGNSALLPAVFIVASIGVFVKLQGAWRHAFATSWLAVYLPFVVMALYTCVWVSCSHCKGAVWTMMPFAPALIPVELTRRFLDLPRQSDATWFAFGILVSVVAVAALTWLVRTRGWCWRCVGVVAMVLYCTFAAIGTLALIRA